MICQPILRRQSLIHRYLFLSPRAFVDLLANSLPAQGTYFVQILLVATFLGQGLELLRVRPLAIALVRSMSVWPNLTKKEREKTLHGILRPLSDPFEFEHAEIFANVVLYFMVNYQTRIFQTM